MPELATDLAPADDDERLDQAEGVVRDFCGWHIAPSRTDTVRIFGAPVNLPILLPSMYVTGIVSVTDQGTVLDADLYDFEQAGILRRVDGYVWASGFGALEVKFTHGYSDTPPAVARAVQAVAASIARDSGGLSSKTAGPFSETYLNDLAPMDRATLSRYRIPVGP